MRRRTGPPRAKGLSFSHVAFKADDVTFPILRAAATAEDAQILCILLQNGDYLVVTPPPSKSDQFGLIWGSLPIYVPFDSTDPAHRSPFFNEYAQKRK